MKEHPVLDCPDKEMAILRAYRDCHQLERKTLETLSFKGEGLPKTPDDYIHRKIEVINMLLLAQRNYLVGLIWEVEQRRKAGEDDRRHPQEG